jgi:hypothetical protein
MHRLRNFGQEDDMHTNENEFANDLHDDYKWAMKANALLTASYSITTEEAVRYLEHGPEMAQFILNVANGSLRESIWDTAVELCEKLEGK